MNNGLKHLPLPIQKQLLLRFVGGIIFIILFAIMMIMSKDFTLSLPALVVSIFLLINVVVIYHTFSNNKYIAVEGTCLRVDETEIRKRIKAIYLAADEGILKIQIKHKPPKIKEGSRVTVYMSPSTPIYEKDDIMILNNYFAIEQRKDINNGNH